MNKITIECYDGDCEMLSFVQGEGLSLEFKFNRQIMGYICLGHLAARIEGDSRVLNLGKLPDGEYSPFLVTEDERITLPQIKKECGVLSPVRYDLAYLGELSLRTKRMSDRIRCLEEKLNELEKIIVGSKIF